MLILRMLILRMPERTAGACSQNAGALWVKQMTTGAHIRTAGAQFLVCQSVVGQTKHCRSAHCDYRSMHSDYHNAVLHYRSVVALEASLSKQTVGALWIRQSTVEEHIGTARVRFYCGKQEREGCVKRNKGTLILFNVTFGLGGFCDKR
ncbi:hypothetical protein AMTRI_Chr09g22030 [Amborella trichopoda]